MLRTSALPVAGAETACGRLRMTDLLCAACGLYFWSCGMTRLGSGSPGFVVRPWRMPIESMKILRRILLPVR